MAWCSEILDRSLGARFQSWKIPGDGDVVRSADVETNVLSKNQLTECPTHQNSG